MRTVNTLERGEQLQCNKCERELTLLNAWFVLAPPTVGGYWAYCSPDCLEQLTIEFAIEDAP